MKIVLAISGWLSVVIFSEAMSSTSMSVFEKLLMSFSVLFLFFAISIAINDGLFD